MTQKIIDADMVALSVFGAQSQANRFMRMDFPQADGPANAVMLVNKVRMREELSRDFRIEAEVLSDDAGIPLKSMMGRMVTISLVRENGSLRYMNGYVGTFRFVRTDGGFAYYQMLLSPWLAFARLRQDNVSFHHRSTVELTETTFGHYRQRDWKTRLGPRYDDRKLTCANQHNETDYINGGGSYARFSAGGIEQGSNGTFVAHAVSHSLLGPNSIDAPSLGPHLTTATSLESFDEQFRLVAKDGKTPIANKRYCITASDGTCWEGISNEEGLTERIYTSSPTELSLNLLDDEV